MPVNIKISNANLASRY